VPSQALTAIEGALEAARLLEIEISHATLGVVGATGSIGRVCAEILAPKFGSTLLIGRNLARTQELAAQLPRAQASADPSDLRQADVVITVTSAAEAVILPEHLKPGSVICDVARPRDVSVRVAKERSDVLVIEGGVVSVPGNVEFNFENCLCLHE
jgi:predicted amino acid dehydrogenase